MSDPKRANLITVGAPKSAKNIVNKTVRLNINLVESNESKYPELNYKELVIAEERKKRVQNGKTSGLDPFSDNDDDVERVARKFEQKYGGKSTYGRKGRSKQDDFADIGAGYDENDSFIDNTHGYDEMIPPECDTLFGGFYINCGSLEFKTVPQEQTGADEARRNKRRISSSSSEEDSSDSSSDSESQDEKDPKAVANGAIDSHKTEHRKKKNKKDKQKAKKIRRTDSSAANSGKQTSDDNIQADGESVDSRTSHSDSLTSKPAPSSENPITSDSSRDTEMRTDVKLPQVLTQVLDALEASVAKYLTEHPATAASQLLASNDAHIQRLEQTLKKHPCEAAAALAARSRAARLLGVSRDALLQRAKASAEPSKVTPSANAQPSTTALTTSTAPTNSVKPYKANNKRKVADEEDIDVTKLTDEQREAKIVETMKRLMDLIEERKPSMFASYNSECDRVREENSSRKKLTSEGSTHVEKRLPKRRFPWCHRTRQLLARISKLAGSEQAAAMLLADRVLPMFPKGFVRMPTLMRQANISKDIKVPDTKRQRLGSASTNLYPHIPPLNPQTVPLNSQTAPLNPQIAPPNTQTAPPNPVKTPPTFPEQIQFPSSLTVTATAKTSPEKSEPPHHSFGMIMNNFTISKDLIIEREKTKEDKKEEIYIPPNNIGSITITPMPIHKDKKQDKTNQSSLIRVKSPAVLNESIHKKDVKTKKTDKPTKEKRVDTPLRIDTSFQLTKKDPSPKQKEPSPKGEEATQRLIESLRVKENNIPRPTLVPVHHSPTFAKPDKRPPDLKKKKEIMIVSDTDPLSDHEPVSVDDSSSDVEVIENDKSDKCEVPSKDNSLKVPKRDETRDAADKDISDLMRNIREMEHSQEPPKFNSNSFSGVVTNSNAKLWPRGFQRNGLSAPDDRDKFAERTSLNKTDGYNGVNG